MPEKVSPIVSRPKEHLKKGVKPIYVCVDVEPSHGYKTEKMEVAIGKSRMDAAEQVDYFSTQDNFAISDINDRDKISKKFAYCMGLTVAGIEKGTKKKISFFAHADALAMIGGHSQSPQTGLRSFFKELEQKNLLMREKCDAGTISAVMFGGTATTSIASHTGLYEDSVNSTSQEMERIFGFKPAIVPPKTTLGKVAGLDNAFFDNENRAVHLFRPKINPDAGDFVADDINKVKDKWK